MVPCQLYITSVTRCSQGLSHQEYERKKEAMADELCQRLESLFPGLRDAITLKEVRGTGGLE